MGGSANVAALNVTGTATINRLVVADAKITASLTVTSTTRVVDLIVGGHIMSAGNVPVAAAQAAARTSPAVALEGTDVAGVITVKTGTNCMAGGAITDVTFDKPYEKAPVVTLTVMNENSANLKYYVTQTTGGFTIKVPAKLAASKEYTFNYHIIQ